MNLDEKSQVIKFINNYKTAYENSNSISLNCYETPQKFKFEEQLEISNIDDSYLNNMPESEHISSIFVIDGDRHEDISKMDDIREQSGNTYKSKTDIVIITITINKSFLIEEYELNNKYIFSTLKDFFYSVSSNKLSWTLSLKKMNIFLINDNDYLCEFESDFLNIKPYGCEIKEDDINEHALERFMKFNKIYTIYEDKKIRTYFDYPLTWLSTNECYELVYVSKNLLDSFFKIICNNDLGESKYLIRGHKAITVELIDMDIPKETAIQVGELFDFILDDEKHHDKLNILRNTLTIFLDSNSSTSTLIETCEEILKSVKYNFNLYIQDKVKLFLEQKNKLLQEFINTTKKIEDLTNGLIAQIRTVLLSLLGTIFLSLIGDINKSKTSAIMNLVLLSYIFYLLVNMILIWKQLQQKEALLYSLKNYTQELGVIGENQDNNLSYASLEKKYLKKHLDIYSNYRKWMLLSLGGLILLFISLYISNMFDFFPWPKELIKIIIGY
ncbi:hypothetical protein [Enterococcus sp.]|uniref:hypothetical protein n=1 Tax=Enterococcus sp. TaxID=35783 RepID=UPI002FCA0D9E